MTVNLRRRSVATSSLVYCSHSFVFVSLRVCCKMQTCFIYVQSTGESPESLLESWWWWWLCVRPAPLALNSTNLALNADYEFFLIHPYLSHSSSWERSSFSPQLYLVSRSNNLPSAGCHADWLVHSTEWHITPNAVRTPNKNDTDSKAGLHNR